MPRNQAPKRETKRIGGRNVNGDMPPVSGINLVGSPDQLLDQEIDEFDLFQNRKIEHKPINSPPKRFSGPGASGNTPIKSYETEKFNATNIVTNKQVVPARQSISRTKKLTSGKYAVTFSIGYETKFGEEVWILGSIPELGSWKEYKHKLFWGDNHCWQTKVPILLEEPYFEYKFILFGTEGELMFWENGINRIADLETLPHELPSTPNAPKHVFVHDVWEEYKIRFTIFDPLYEKGDQMMLIPEAGSGLSSTYPMHRIESPEEWLLSKYGKPVPLWECEIPLENQNGDAEGQFLKNHNIAFMYTYAKKRKNGTVQERQPSRRFKIDNPNTYRGELSDPTISSTPHYKISDSVMAVNGVIEKADGTFLYDFACHEVIEEGRIHNIIIGPCPQSNIDVKKIVIENKITAVLSIQNETEKEQRQISDQQNKKWFRDNGIKSYINYPVEDNNLEPYSDDNFQGCKALDQLLQQKHRVYIHDTAGKSRSQTMVITYLALFKKSKFWFNSGKVEEIVRKSQPGCSPNMLCVQRTIQKYNHLFQKNNKLLDEAEKRRLEIIAQREHKNLWERREIYLKGERDKNNRLRDQENQMIGQRRKTEEMERQKLIKFYHDKEIRLNQELKNINIEEEEMIRRIKQQQIDENTQYEHYIQCHTEYAGVSDAEIDDQCQALFVKSPIKFISRRDVKLEQYLKKLIEEHNITIPIVHIKGSLYLIGLNKIHLEQKADDVIAQVGGGYQKFEPYIFKNHKIIERQLIIKMIQSKESLEWIVDALIRGEKIPTSHQTAYDSATRITGSPQVSRIQLLRIPSNRLDKNGFIRSDVIQTRRTTMIGSSQSPTRMGLSPTRLDTYTSPIARKASLASPTSKKNKMQGSNKGQSESPIRSSKKGAFNSPQSKIVERSFSPTPGTKKLIKQIETKYESKRQVVLKQLTSVESYKIEHYNAKDQTIPDLNKGKYAYIHTEKSRAI